MAWRKYNSIENTYNEFAVNKAREVIHPSMPWVVSEKVDGSNGSYVVSSDGTIKMAKRSCVIGDNDNFDGMKDNLEKHKDQFLKVFQIMNRFYSCFDSVIIYGENFGGVYPHPDVARVSNSKKIQGRVYYTPEINFIVYDIAIVFSKVDPPFYVPFGVFKEAVTEAGLYSTPVLFIGSLDEALSFPNDFETKVPSMFNLPPIPNNVAEGVVIKPFAEYAGGSDRIIFKNKNDIFSEVKSKDKVELSDDIKSILAIAENYVTESRLHNIISHFTDLHKEDFGKVLKEFTMDVLKDFEKDNQVIFNTLDKSTIKIISKNVTNLTRSLLKQKFFNYVAE